MASATATSRKAPGVPRTSDDISHWRMRWASRGSGWSGTMPWRGHAVAGANKAPDRLAGLFFSISSILASAPAWERRIAEPDLGINPSIRWTWRRHWSVLRRRIADGISATSFSTGDIARTPSMTCLRNSRRTSSSPDLAGGFAYYRAAHAGRIAMMRGCAPHCHLSRRPPACDGPSTIRCSPMPGPTGWARPSPRSISRRSPVSPFPTANSSIAPAPILAVVSFDRVPRACSRALAASS